MDKRRRHQPPRQVIADATRVGHKAHHKLGDQAATAGMQVNENEALGRDHAPHACMRKAHTRSRALARAALYAAGALNSSSIAFPSQIRMRIVHEPSATL